MAEEQRRIPVQSGSMYIALAQLRGQASSARWQHAVVFLVKQGIVDAGIPRGHAALHDDRGLRLPHF